MLFKITIGLYFFISVASVSEAYFHANDPGDLLHPAGDIKADDVLSQTMFAKNESGYEWIIGLQLNREDTYFKGKISKVVYEIVVMNEGREIERTNLFILDLGDHKLENANGLYNSSQLYKLTYNAPAYYEKLDFKLAFREIHFDTGEVARFDGEGNYVR